MTLSFKEWLLLPKKPSMHRNALITLNILENSYKNRGIISDSNSFLSGFTFNKLLSHKLSSFDFHLLKLSIIDNKKVEFPKNLNIPPGFLKRKLYLLIQTLLRKETDFLEHLIKDGNLNDINVKLISAFSLFHLTLKTKSGLGFLNSLKPDIKFLIPHLFNMQYSIYDPFLPVSAQVYKILLEIKHSVIKEPTNTADFISNEENFFLDLNFPIKIDLCPVEEFPIELEELKNYKLTNEENELLNFYWGKPKKKIGKLYPLDFICLRNEKNEFDKLVISNPGCLKYSENAFYLCKNPAIALKLFYYNCPVHEDTIVYHCIQNNIGMVVFLLSLGVSAKYLRVCALLCAKKGYFNILKVILNSIKLFDGSVKSEFSVLKFLGMEEEEDDDEFKLCFENESSFFPNPNKHPSMTYELAVELLKYTDTPFIDNELNPLLLDEMDLNSHVIVNVVKNLIWMRYKTNPDGGFHWWLSKEYKGKKYADDISRFEIFIKKFSQLEEIKEVCKSIIGCNLSIKDIMMNTK